MFYKIVLAAKSFGSMGHAVLVDERGTHAAPMAFSTLARMLPTMACWGGQPRSGDGVSRWPMAHAGGALSGLIVNEQGRKVNARVFHPPVPDQPHRARPPTFGGRPKKQGAGNRPLARWIDDQAKRLSRRIPIGSRPEHSIGTLTRLAT